MSKEVRYFYVPEAATAGELPADEAVHATRVLRLQAGDEMFLMDGQGSFYRAQVSCASNKRCMYSIMDVLPQTKTWQGYVHLAIAPTKDIGRIEWMVEKATEVGVDEISFLNCQFSERRTIREDRLLRIVVSAMKQSRKAWLPKVNAMQSFRDFITTHTEGQRFICHCYPEIERADFFDTINRNYAAGHASVSPDSVSNDAITILVGPEGDFSVEEVRLALDGGYQSVSLGSSRLRTETAGLAAVMMANLTLRTP